MLPRLTFLITDLHRGGSPLMLADLAPGLLRRGFEVEVVSIAPEGEVTKLLRERGVPVYSLVAEDSRDVSVVPRFVNHLRRSRPDVVISILIHANLLASISKPFVARQPMWVHSIHTVQERPRWHWYLQGVLNSFADAFVAPSQAIVRKLQAFGPVPRPVVIPNGIDVERFRLAAPVADGPWSGGGERAFVVGYLGRLDPVKRIPLLIEAAGMLWEKIPNLHVALIGGGAEEPHLKVSAARQGEHRSRIHLLPPTPFPEKWYKTFDVFCSPSPAEGFGLTLLEAAAAGLPVIACDTPAVRETLKNAVWIPEDAVPQDVASAIMRIFKESGGSTRADEAQIEHSLQNMVDRYAQWLQTNLWRS